MIFDVFQTLVEFDGDHVTQETWDFMSDWCGYRGVRVDADNLSHSYETTSMELASSSAGTPPDIDVREVWGALLGEDPASSVVAEAALVFRQITTRSICVAPGMHRVLDSLVDSRLGVVSNTQRAYTEPELRMFGLYDLFDAVVFSSDVRAAKPDTRIFQRAFELMNVGHEDCVYVGDNPLDDVVGAHRAGMPVLLLERDGQASRPPEWDEPPEARVSAYSPDLIVRAIQRLLDE